MCLSHLKFENFRFQKLLSNEHSGSVSMKITFTIPDEAV